LDEEVETKQEEVIKGLDEEADTNFSIDHLFDVSKPIIKDSSFLDANFNTEEVVSGLDEEVETKQEEVISGLDEEEENIYVLFDDRKIKFTRKMTKDCSFLDAIFDTEEKMCRLNKEFKYCTYDNMLIVKQFLEIENNDFPNDVFNFDETLEKTLYKRPEALSFISTVIKDEQVLDLINLANYLGSSSFCMFLCYRMRSIINKENISYIKSL
jgi:hypothetical protein